MNYIGSKYSLIGFINDTICSVTGLKDGKGVVFADLFAGTGVVGATFKKKGCHVIANDLQYYSYVLNKQYIEGDVLIECALLDYLGNLKSKKGFIYKNYCAGSGSERNYFTDYNGMKCDAIRMELEKLHSSGEIDDKTYFYLLASLVNSIDKYANTASMYGAFLKSVKKSAQREFKLELLPIISGENGEVYNTDTNELIKKISGDILYLDPPYNERQYCAYYHLLETIAKYDNPKIRGKTGLRDYTDQKSLYCSKRTVEEAFEELIANADFSYIFLSYNNEGLMSLDTIKEIMSKYGEYRRFEKEYRRFKADKDENRNIKADTTTEYLHCLIKENKALCCA